MYALIAIEEEHMEDAGCQEDHTHSWCDQPSYGLSVTLTALHKARREFSRGYEEVTEKSCYYGCADLRTGETAYVVYATYTDGDTFGYNGYWKVLGVAATPEEAEEMRQRASAGDSAGKYSLPWTHYFGHLRDIEVEVLTVLC